MISYIHIHLVITHWFITLPQNDQLSFGLFSDWLVKLAPLLITQPIISKQNQSQLSFANVHFPALCTGHTSFLQILTGSFQCLNLLRLAGAFWPKATKLKIALPSKTGLAYILAWRFGCQGDVPQD